MTRTNLTSKLQIFALAVLANAATLMVKAQAKTPDLKVDVDVNKGGNALTSGDWMSNPLVWVIGALILIVIIALVARGGGNK